MKPISAYIAATCLFLASASSVLAEPLFFDSFENKDYTGSKGAALGWSKTGVASVVSAPGTDLVREGSNSLRLQGSEWVEQRFWLSKAHDEVWFRFWLRVPSNYEHDHHNNASNRKFFAVWMDGYSTKGDGPTVVWEFWKDGNLGSNIAVHWSEGNYTAAGGHQQRKPFISYPSDQGRWMQVVLRVKASTGSLSNGEVEMWRRWSDEGAFTQLHKVTDAKLPIPATGPQGWKNGYLLGWANANYIPNTQWHFDSFTVSDESLLQVDGISTAPPAAPVLSLGQ